jgi:hypothetical protein
VLMKVLFWIGIPLGTLLVIGVSGKGWLRAFLAVVIGVLLGAVAFGVWMIPASFYVGGHFGGAEWFLLLPVFLAAGYIAGVWIGMWALKRLAPRR